MSDKNNRNGNGVPGFGINRRTTLKGLAAAGTLGSGLLTVGTSPVAAASGGPVVLMGIDADDGGHGSNSIFAGVVGDMLTNVSNGGSGLLVIGANGTTPRDFWDDMGSLNSESVTYVTGSSNIASQSFSGFAIIGVAGSDPETPGGMTQAENDALVARAADIASFVNGGGGLFGLSQTDFSNAWDYIGSIGSFTTEIGLLYNDVTATTEGNAVGITDTNLDVCCWHDVFLTYPSFLNILATNNVSTSPGAGEAAALGGATVTIQLCEDEEVDLIAGQHDVIGTVTVSEDEDELTITYSLDDDWYMTESHLHVAEDCDDIPQTGKGNPKVGHFEHSRSYDPPVQEDSYVVDQPAGTTSEDTLCIAAHAVVFDDENENGTYDEDEREETAWGDGDRFTQRGNWAMHFEYDICDPAPTS